MSWGAGDSQTNPGGGGAMTMADEEKRAEQQRLADEEIERQTRETQREMWSAADDAAAINKKWATFRAELDDLLEMFGDGEALQTQIPASDVDYWAPIARGYQSNTGDYSVHVSTTLGLRTFGFDDTGAFRRFTTYLAKQFKKNPSAYMRNMLNNGRSWKFAGDEWRRALDNEK